MADFEPLLISNSSVFSPLLYCESRLLSDWFELLLLMLLDASQLAFRSMNGFEIAVCLDRGLGSMPVV